MVTVILFVVSPVDHEFPTLEDEVNTTLSPAQNVVDPLVEIVGADGLGCTVTVVAVDVAVHVVPTVTE